MPSAGPASASNPSCHHKKQQHTQKKKNLQGGGCVQYAEGTRFSLHVTDVFTFPPVFGICSGSAATLRAPTCFPKALLRAPLHRGGFGVPELEHRLTLRYVIGILTALNSRNSLVRLSLLALLEDPLLDRVQHHDVLFLRHTLASLNIEISHPPHRHLPPLPLRVTLHRPYSGGPVVLVSDGSAVPGRLGWGAVVADCGGLVGSTYGSIPVDLPTSWAAEWHGKLAAVCLAAHLGVPPEQWTWSIADNVAASLGADGGRPSGSPYLDALRLSQVPVIPPPGTSSGTGSRSWHLFHILGLLACRVGTRRRHGFPPPTVRVRLGFQIAAFRTEATDFTA